MVFSPEMYREVRVLVTGATGFVGRWVTLSLSQAGADLIAVTRDADSLEAVCSRWGFQAKAFIADLSQPGAFRKVFRETRPAVVFHLAGYGVDPSERDETTMRRLNVELAEEVADTVAAHANHDVGWRGLRLVNTGSAFEYGIISGPIHEHTKPNPNGLYGRTKLEGTRCIQEARERIGLRAGTARLTTVYGPGEHENRLLPSLLRIAELGEPLDLTGGKQERDFTFVGDVAEGLLRLGTLSDLPEGIVNLATGRLSTVRSFVESARGILGIREELLRLGSIPYRADEVWQGPLDVARLETLLHWRPPTGIREGIGMSRDFLRARGRCNL
jgi:UDP-glucose 4-epimerase